jgi:hypothetical protein
MLEELHLSDIEFSLESVENLINYLIFIEFYFLVFSFIGNIVMQTSSVIDIFSEICCITINDGWCKIIFYKKSNFRNSTIGKCKFIE